MFSQCPCGSQCNCKNCSCNVVSTDQCLRNRKIESFVELGDPLDRITNQHQSDIVVNGCENNEGTEFLPSQADSSLTTIQDEDDEQDDEMTPLSIKDSQSSVYCLDCPCSMTLSRTATDFLEGQGKTISTDINSISPRS